MRNMELFEYHFVFKFEYYFKFLFCINTKGNSELLKLNKCQVNRINLFDLKQIPQKYYSSKEMLCLFYLR